MSEERAARRLQRAIDCGSRGDFHIAVHYARLAGLDPLALAIASDRFECRVAREARQ